MSTLSKVCYFICFIVLYIGCKTDGENVQYSEGNNIFYNRCTSCHLVKGSVDIDTTLNMSSKSLHQLFLEKPSFEKIKDQLKDSSYHESLGNEISEKEIESIHYFIKHSFDPMPQK